MSLFARLPPLILAVDHVFQLYALAVSVAPRSIYRENPDSVGPRIAYLQLDHQFQRGPWANILRWPGSVGMLTTDNTTDDWMRCGRCNEGDDRDDPSGVPRGESPASCRPHSQCTIIASFARLATTRDAAMLLLVARPSDLDHL